MCDLCTTAAQTAARTKFLADVSQVRLQRYADLTAANLGPFSKSGFSQAVRNHILNLLPKVPVSFIPVVCATCNKPKDARSVELDHIIPVRSYVRYKLVIAHAGLTTLSSALLNQLADNAYTDQANLIFICKSCNKDKSDNQPTMAMSRHGTATVLQRLRANLPADRQPDLDALDLIMNAVNAPTPLGAYFRGELRVKRSSSRVRVASRRYRSEPYPTRRNNDEEELVVRPPRLSLVQVSDGAELPGAISAHLGLTGPAIEDIDGQVIRMFDGSRANIRLLMGETAFRAHLARQTQAAGAPKDLRVCLYCLGMYHKQAFQIEHVDPVNRAPVTGSDATEQDYNDNLLGICGSCNASRNKKTLTQPLLQGLRDTRVAEGLPGLESICKDMAVAAINHIHQILQI